MHNMTRFSENSRKKLTFYQLESQKRPKKTPENQVKWEHRQRKRGKGRLPRRADRQPEIKFSSQQKIPEAIE